MKISIRKAIAIALFCTAGCVPPPRGAVDYGIVMRLRDLTTNYPAMPRATDEAPLMFTFQGGYPNMELADFERTQLAAWQRSIRVVTWPEREMVPGHWEVLTEPWRIAFVQDAPFAERWYAMQINLTTLPASLGIWHDARPELGVGDHALIDGWVTSRFHVGSSAPMALVSLLWEVNGPGGFGFYGNEPLISSRTLRADELLQIEARQDLRCEATQDVFPAGMPIEASWRCSRALAEGESVTITQLATDLHSASGVAASSCGSGNPPTWSSAPGRGGAQEIPVRNCADSAFLPSVAEGL